MKYIKQFENIENEVELKKLLSHLCSIIKDYGYAEENYIDNGKWETDFHSKESVLKNTKYAFGIKLHTDNFYKRPFINLEITVPLRISDPFAIFFMGYLKTIKGMKIIKEEHISIFSGIDKIFFKILDKDVDRIIRQINKKDIDSKLELIKYNI